MTFLKFISSKIFGLEQLEKLYKQEKEKTQNLTIAYFFINCPLILILKNKIMDSKEKRKEYLKQYREKYKKEHRRITITLTNEEYQYFQSIAKKEKLKFADLVKTLALAKSEEVFIPTEIKEKTKEFVLLMRNIANNINQIARHSNTIKKLVDENNLLMFIKSVEDRFIEFTKTLLKNKNE